MTRTPNLGTTWEEAVKSAYTLGYEAFEYSAAGVIDEAREVLEEDGEDAAYDYLLNEVDWVVSETSDHRRLWWAIEDFYEEHMGEEAYERLMREAAVAEDLDSAFQAGAHHSILGKEYDESSVSHFYGGDDE